MSHLRTVASLALRNLAYPLTCAPLCLFGSLTIAAGWGWAHGRTHVFFVPFLVLTLLFSGVFALAQRRLQRSFVQIGRVRR